MDRKNLPHVAAMIALSSTMMLVGRQMFPRYADAIAAGHGHGNIALDTLFMLLPTLAFATGAFGLFLAGRLIVDR